MKATDVRLNNIFKEKYSGEIIKVIGITPERILFSLTFHEQVQAEPIRINEYWLEKLGLHSYELGYYNLTDEVTIDVEGQIRIENEHTTKRIWIDDCYHVHSLMNFYHSLTGQELEVKND